MSFEVAADAYGRFMGRFSEPLALRFADFVGVAPPASALDVGCGPGALTSVLQQRLGAEHVSAVDPSEAFVAAVRGRCPGVDVRRATAEDLPFVDVRFDFVLAQLVVHFMTDPAAGLREMARVARAGGVVAANVWNHASDEGPLSLFWRAVRALDSTAADESQLAGVQEGALPGLFAAAGMADATTATLRVSVPYDSFEEWWEPYTLGVGPAGEFVAHLDADGVTALRERCREMLPTPPFEISAVAWTVSWRKPSG